METDKIKSIVNRLRNKESLKQFKKVNGHNQKMFVTFQLNKDSISWSRFVSLDRKNWMKWNSYLRLKDVVKLYFDK